LSEKGALLREKIHTSALLALVFSRPPHSRTLEFSLIAHECRLSPNEVEFLIMKAFALGLIRGTIDQVDELVHITWMQGRVLDRRGVEGMKERLEQWSEGVNALEGWVYRAGQGVWVK
jgi:26S proteasome regulatory subunit N9